MTSPSAAWYEPPEPVICCAVAEDDPEHDREACLADQAESAAEARAERLRDDAKLFRRSRGWAGDWRLEDPRADREAELYFARSRDTLDYD